MKQECTRWLLVPLTLAGIRHEIRLYAIWYDTKRPHMALTGRTPHDVYTARALKPRRLEPRPNWPHRPARCRPGGDRFTLDVSYIEGRKHLPVVELRRAA